MGKRHLMRGGTVPFRRAACGLREPRVYTNDPAYVDCLACKRTLFMADAELRQQQQQKRKRREVQ